jgi:TldD protein
MCSSSACPTCRCCRAGDLSINDLVSATDRGILISGDGSFSIDQQLQRAVGGQTFHEIKGGRLLAR